MYAKLSSSVLRRLPIQRHNAPFFIKSNLRSFCTEIPKGDPKRLNRIHYFNAAMVCGLFTLYLMSDNIVINDGKLLYIGSKYIYYMDGFQIKTKPVKLLNDINIVKTPPANINEEAINTFKRISNDFPFVIYSNHTCVLLNNDSKGISKDEILSKANEIMLKYGPVDVATPSGDFGMIRQNNNNYNGYLITCNCSDMLTFVSHRYEMQSQSGDQMDIDVCLYGRKKRDLDAKALTPIYWNNCHIDETLVQ